MFRFLILFLALFAIFATPLIPQTSWAQFGSNNDEEEDGAEEIKILNPYDPKYRPNPHGILPQPSIPRSPVPDTQYLVHVKNALTGREGDFIINIKTVGDVSGCLAPQLPALSVKTGSKKMTLEISSELVTADTAQTQYIHYGCDIKTNEPVANFIFNKNDFIRDNIEKIEIVKNGMGPISLFDVNINSHKAIFEQRLPVLNKDVIWFYPPGTLKLFNGSLALDNAKTYQKITNLARQNGLVLLEEFDPGFQELQLNEQNTLFVVDTERRFADRFENQGDVFALGEIETLELFTGPEGDYGRTKLKPVFARLAGSE